MEAKNPQHASYRVEVSGWDDSENFFAEIATVRWDTDNRLYLSLRARLREDSVIFVRLMQPHSGEANFPVAYIASKILAIEMDGRTSMMISRLHPRPAYRQTTEATETSSTQVA